MGIGTSASHMGAAMSDIPRKAPMVWQCKIGIMGSVPLPVGSDFPMRQAIREAFYRLTGVQAEFVFSGWNADLTDGELMVVKERH